ncbi:YbfB/YjiJ family MFS transporter [Amycolatopsis sp. NPDC059657]|uniref:YbfB/YjiJ family MFS transporter n=1 Tax=Amycolatopsis sp. NPDC059657 TaxID=3346899 RepID=UPI00366CE92A
MTRVESPRVIRPLAAAFGLMLGPAVALGFARFAYALVLPSMRADLHWSFATAGSINTANALGYLFGALGAGKLAQRFGERRAFTAGLAITALALLASAATGQVAVLLTLRLISGVAGAVCFVVGGGLMSQAGRDCSHARATLLLGIYFAGGGVGIVVSGLLVPAALSWGGWRAAWLVLGGLSLLAMLIAVPIARRVPESETLPATTAKAPLRPLATLMTCYGFFGAGYIAYMTFIIAVFGASAGEITAFWVVLGLSAAVSAFVWNRPLSTLRPGAGAAAVLAVLTIGAVLPVLWQGGFFVSAVLFGGTFLTVASALTSGARTTLPPDRWTAGIAALTAAFALGQCVGPVLAGVLSDGPGGLRLGLTIGAALLAGGAVVALVHDRRTAGARR